MNHNYNYLLKMTNLLDFNQKFKNIVNTIKVYKRLSGHLLIINYLSLKKLVKYIFLTNTLIIKFIAKSCNILSTNIFLVIIYNTFCSVI